MELVTINLLTNMVLMVAVMYLYNRIRVLEVNTAIETIAQKVLSTKFPVFAMPPGFNQPPHSGPPIKNPITG